MSAIDNKHLIEIVAINEASGISKKTGNAWTMHKAQCVVRGPDNSVVIGELMLPKELALTTTPGKYLAEFELGVSFERIVVPRITALHVFGETAKPVPQANKAAA
jgi:hypothetical protein